MARAGRTKPSGVTRQTSRAGQPAEPWPPAVLEEDEQAVNREENTR